MQTDKHDFAWMVGQALQDSSLKSIRPVIEKELLHYDILFALNQKGFLQNLVMQGGTCLRLCYGNSRFSEDLDFAGGTDFSPLTVAGMAECIERSVGSRYGLKVTVKKPQDMLADEAGRPGGMKVYKWQIAVETAPQRPDVARQRIKVEVANVPAYTRESLPLRGNYDFLPDGYDKFLILVESREEIMADKLIALPTALKRLRHRDIWDLAWLDRKNTAVNPEFVERKLADYQVSDYRRKSEAMAARLPDIVHGQEFRLQMQRFFPADVYAQTLAKKEWLEYMAANVAGLLGKTAAMLAGETKEP